jgi:hypothetical protein
MFNVLFYKLCNAIQQRARCTAEDMANFGRGTGPREKEFAMSSAKMHRRIVAAAAVSLLLALPVWAQAGAAPKPGPALQASTWDSFVDILRRAGLGGWLQLAGGRGAVSHAKDGNAPLAGAQDVANPPGGAGGGSGQHGTIDPNGGNQ